MPPQDPAEIGTLLAFSQANIGSTHPFQCLKKQQARVPPPTRGPPTGPTQGSSLASQRTRGAPQG
jgi:hypothetical protein